MGESCLDHELSKKMASLIENLTTTGSPSLNVDKMKGLKKICRTSDLYVEHAFHLLRTQLTREHSEIRLSAFQIVDELFNRSHIFRELLVSDFQNFLELTVETDHNQPLPPPRGAAVKLRSDTLKAIQQWQDKFGAAYKKLSLGYNYLKSCKHVDFSDIRARSQAERRRNELQQERKQKALAAKLDKVQKEIAEQKKDIEDAAMEAENCLEFLVPKPDSLLFCKSDFNVVPDKGSASQEMLPDLAASSVSLQHNGQHNQEHEQNTDERNKRSVSKIDENQISFPATRLTDGVSVEERHREMADNNATVAYQSNKEKSSFNLLQEALGNTQHWQSRAHFELDISGTRYFQVSEKKIIEHDDNESVDFENIEEENENRMVQVHGLGSRKYNLEIEIGTDKVSLVETEDNQDLCQSLKDAACLITMRYLPQIVKWLEILSKAGASQSEIKAMINLKARLEQIKTKCTELQVVRAETASGQQRSDSDEEFEEVPEKEGYEPVIPSHLWAEYGLDNGSEEEVVQKTAKMGTLSSRTHAVKKTEMKMKQPSTDKTLHASEAPATASKHKPTSSSWSLSERNGAWSSNDPTSRAANLAKLGLKDDRAGKTLSSKEKPSCTITSSESSNIPELPFGPDLAHWGRSDKIEAPTVVKNESLHRFWAPAQVETEKPSQMEMAAIMNRTFHFVGNFVPVKWKCRVMLPSGQLCERMDRVKCPFHGKIIARDKNGEPSNPEDVKVEVPETSMSNSSEIPPWLDAELQADIEAATGHDLGSERSKTKQKKGPKGKAKGKKYPGLTDVKEANNTTRSRLEAKVFNRSAMKRVASRLDAADYKRLRDKFANQFNYAHK